MSSALAHKVLWTEEEYLTFEEGSDTKHEYLDGEVYAMAGAKSRHNAICARLIAKLTALVEGGPCGVFTSDQRIHIAAPKKVYTYADGGIACGDWQISDKDRMSLLNPVLLFEVLSRSTREYDRGAKLAYYRQIESLTDVLILDQPVSLIEHHHRGPRGWRLITRRRGTLVVLGGKLSVEDVYNVPPGLPEDD